MLASVYNPQIHLSPDLGAKSPAHALSAYARCARLTVFAAAVTLPTCVRFKRDMVFL